MMLMWRGGDAVWRHPAKKLCYLSQDKYSPLPLPVPLPPSAATTHHRRHRGPPLPTGAAAAAVL